MRRLIVVLLLLTIAGAQQSFFFNNIVASSASATSELITWTDCAPSYRLVRWGTTTAYGTNIPWSTTLSQNHSATLPNLTVGQQYHYQLSGKDANGVIINSSDHTFSK